MCISQLIPSSGGKKEAVCISGSGTHGGCSIRVCVVAIKLLFFAFRYLFQLYWGIADK